MFSICTQSFKTIAVIGNYLPRLCGIATFTSDLCEVLAGQLSSQQNVIVLAMDDTNDGYDYPERVKFEIRDKIPADYLRAAEFLNLNKSDAVILQHEFGIFGGSYGTHIFQLLQNLRIPVLTTLHTVLCNPLPEQKAVISELARLSDKLIVMSQKCHETLKTIYHVADDKIVIIPHGIPDVPFMDTSFYKDQFGVENRKVILTFGLLSPSKGIKYAIDAMSEVVLVHPDAVYVVLGATHPHVVRANGEMYRYELMQRVRERGLDDHVLFFNQFVDLPTLIQFLTAADIYLTPYLDQQQAVSGTLSQAMGAGKAIVSTPYAYAEEMLNDERGILVPFADSGALGQVLVELLNDDLARNRMRKKAYQYCRTMIWPQVAESYLEVISDCLKHRLKTPKFTDLKNSSYGFDALPIVQPDHLRMLTDNTGIFQHAFYSVPDRSNGYCVDDNARALLATNLYYNLRKDDQVLYLYRTYLSFLLSAFDNERLVFDDFLSYDRKWLQTNSSEEAHSRAIWALGCCIETAPDNALMELMCRLFTSAIDIAEKFQHPRAWAFTLLGIHCYLNIYSGDAMVRALRASLSQKLMQRFLNNSNNEWRWCDEVLTYGNARLPHALLLTGHDLEQCEMRTLGLTTLEWLFELQLNGKGYLSIIGNDGWLKKNGGRALFSQQPLEVMGLIQACSDAFRVTRNGIWLKRARTCLDWFLGRNDLGLPLYDYGTGGCHDGIDPQGINENMGAESTLSWLISLLTVYEMQGEEVLLGKRMGTSDEREKVRANETS